MTRTNRRAAQPGVSTRELDRLAHARIVGAGARPAFLGYRGYPKSLCTSLNEVICHGIPDDTMIADGDIVNVDITAFIGGVHGDTNATFLAGNVDAESRLLVERTHEAMMRGIRAVAPGRPLNAVGRVIESYARRFGYGVVRDFTGHGIGTTFHSGLIVPHFDDPSVSVIMEQGMTFTIEPMLTLGTIDFDMWPDGWTVVTKDHKRTAQFEHTVLVTAEGGVLASAQRPHQISLPRPGWAEVDAEGVWWGDVRQVCRDLTARSPGPIVGVAIEERRSSMSAFTRRLRAGTSSHRSGRLSSTRSAPRL